jgi:hypothetical protein
LIKIGEEFCGSKSEDLQNSIKKQCSNYFHNYHRACLEELQVFLENEGWEMCPVKPDFTVLQLQVGLPVVYTLLATVTASAGWSSGGLTLRLRNSSLQIRKCVPGSFLLLLSVDFQFMNANANF